MSGLFDRYFLVLAGRVAEADCGAVASAPSPTAGAVSLGWPLDLPDTAPSEVDVLVAGGLVSRATRSDRSDS
jgi:hypothetical protein